MCGRFDMEFGSVEIKEYFDVGQHFPNFSFDINPRKRDLSPGMMIPVIKFFQPGSVWLTEEYWGWDFKVKNDKGKFVKRQIINSRSDTILRELNNPKKVYQRGLSLNRVLIPASGFYEWRDEGGPRKQKYHFKPNNEQLFSLGGFEVMNKTPEGGSTVGVVIITTEPTKQMSEYHDRMPLIISSEDRDDWVKNREFSEEYLNNIFQSNTKNLMIVPV